MILSWHSECLLPKYSVFTVLIFLTLIINLVCVPHVLTITSLVVGSFHNCELEFSAANKDLEADGSHRTDPRKRGFTADFTTNFSLSNIALLPFSGSTGKKKEIVLIKS